MASYRRHDRGGFNGPRPPHRQDHRDYDREMYDDRPTNHRDHQPRNRAYSDDRFSRDASSRYRDWDHQEPRSRSPDRGDYDRRRSPPRGGHRGGYRDRDHEGYRSRSDSRSRSKSHSRTRQRSRSPRFGGSPSKDVMLDGLPLEMTEDDITKELKAYYDVCDIDNVRVIRDKQTRQSRGFGFVRFPSLEGSRAFVEQNFPTVSLYGPSDENGDRLPTQVRIAYSRERDERGRTEKAEGDWTCRICSFVNFSGRKICFKCHSPLDLSAADNMPKQDFVNTGDNDASNDNLPSQFLLIRGLEPSVTEELLAKGVAKMYKPTGGGAETTSKTGKKGGAKVASTTGDANLGAREGSIRSVMLVRDRETNDSWRYGFAEFFSLEDARDALTRFHSFERFTIASKPVVATYIHAGVFVPVTNPMENPLEMTFAAASNPALRLQYWDENAYVRQLEVNAPETQPTAAKDDPSKATSDAAAAAMEQEGLINPEEAKSKKRKGEAKDSTKTKKTAPAHLQFWSNRHAELHGLPKNAPANEEDGDADEGEDNPTSPDPSTQTAPLQQSYGDFNRKCCLLCARQFKTDDEVVRHEQLSKLHRSNLKNADLKEKANAKLAKAGITPGTVPPLPNAAPEYRDRAKERRKAFGSARVALPMKKKAAEAGEEEDKAPVKSKGASLLGKMGWNEGEGLGAQGTGMTAPIAADLYAAGVGLGAEGGKIGEAAEEAVRNTRGDYKEFVEKAKEKAKERFEKMI